MTVLDAMNWRYATKAFDHTRVIAPEKRAELYEALRLSPSSFGLQPWRFVVVRDQVIKEKLFQHSFGNRQVLECSELLIMCAKTEMGDLEVDRLMENYDELGISEGAFNFRAYEVSMKAFLASKTPEERFLWSKEQVYIALGVLLSSAAHLRVDACPIGGFNPEAFDHELGLKEEGYSSVVLCALGYRRASDKYADLKKIRFGSESLFKFIGG